MILWVTGFEVKAAEELAFFAPFFLKKCDTFWLQLPYNEKELHVNL